MANANITTVQVTNTFDEWRVATNDLVSDRNILRNAHYVKDNSNFTVANGEITISRATDGTLLTLTGQGSALVGGTTTTTDLVVNDDASVANQLIVTGNTIITGNLSVSKNTVISQNVNVAGTLNVASNAAFLGYTTNVSGNLIVTGNSANISGNLIVTGNSANISGNLNVTGTANVGSDFSVNTSKFTVLASNGTGRFAGDLKVDGLMNAATANIVTAYIDSLTVTQPIAAPATTTDSGYIVRFGQTTDGDGFFRVKRSTASGNAELYWDDTTTDSWKFLANGQPANVSVGNMTVSGNITANINSTLKSVREYLSNGSASGATTVDLSTSNWFKYTLTGNSTFTFANAPASGNVFTATLVLIQGTGGGKTVSWGNTVWWTGGQVPPATTTAAGNTDVWTLTTYDGGTTFIGTLAVKDAR